LEVDAAVPAHIEALVEQLSGPMGPEARFAVSERQVEFDAIVELMVREHTPGISEVEAQRVAGIVAAGCFGGQHLWRDMELPSRDVLRELLETYFSPFATGNDRDMRWKKYIYRRLCRWEGFHTCRAPSCGECSSYEECFAPED